MSGPTYETLVELIYERAATATSPFFVGVAGAVAVGKTTIVKALSRGLESRGRRVHVLSTDAFLLPNDVLNERGLLMRKGFPESYDEGAIRSVLGRLRCGEAASVSVYSHDIYDIVPGITQTITVPDVMIVEGVVALQKPTVCLLDLAVYVDAAEENVRKWFVERFIGLTETGARDSSSFYHRFSGTPSEQVQQLAEATWDAINGPNLTRHIAPSLARADIVVVKAADHSIAELRKT